MKRLNLERWGGQLLSSRTRPYCLRLAPPPAYRISSIQQHRLASTAVAEDSDLVYEDEVLEEIPRHRSSPFPSPSPAAARKSAKLAALHSRLALSQRLPLETLARTLVDSTADPNTLFNNASLAQVGGSLLSYHVAEYLICTYPRLPMSVLYAAQYAYNGPMTLKFVAKEWGVESAAAPGSEVDAGLLQFGMMKPGSAIPYQPGGSRRDKSNFRRGMSSRVVYDDDFGDLITTKDDQFVSIASNVAHSNFVKAVVGSIFIHLGRESAKTFVKQHILGRHLDISTLFQFKEPVKELARLCAREEFEYPVARVLSETGRLSRTPVFVVGIFSGTEKLGEGAGASLPEARIRAGVAALKAWYLYSPGKDARVPSEMERPNAKAWEPVHIDIGEIVS